MWGLLVLSIQHIRIAGNMPVPPDAGRYIMPCGGSLEVPLFFVVALMPLPCFVGIFRGPTLLCGGYKAPTMPCRAL